MQYSPVVYISPHRSRIRDLIVRSYISDCPYLMLSYFQFVDKDSKILPLHIRLEPLTIGKLRFFLFVESSFSTMKELGFTELDTDDVKGVLFDTNLYLLLITIIVSSFHVSRQVYKRVADN